MNNNKEIKKADDLFLLLNFQSALETYLKYKDNVEISEKISIIYNKLDDISLSYETSKNIIDYYIKNNMFLEIIAYSQLMKNYSYSLFTNNIKIHIKTTIIKNLWLFFIEYIIDFLKMNLIDLNINITFLENLLKTNEINFLVRKVLLKTITILKSTSDIEDKISVPDSDFDFAAADFFRSIGSIESTAKAYIEIAQLALKADKTEFVEKALEPLDELGFKDTEEIILIKKDLTLPYNQRSFISEKIVTSATKYLEQIKESIPIIDSKNHIILARLLYKRNLKLLSKKEYLKAIISESILDQQILVKNLFDDIAKKNKNLADEIFLYIAKSDKISYDIVEYIKLITEKEINTKPKSAEINNMKIEEIHFSPKTEFKKKEVNESIKKEDKQNNISNNIDTLSLETLDDKTEEENNKEIQIVKIKREFDLIDMDNKNKTEEKNNEDFNIDFL